MWGLKSIAIFCTLQCVTAALITLPSAEVDEFFDKVAAEKPYLMKSPNDAAYASSSGLIGLEGTLHGGAVNIEEAKNLVDLAESLNLTTLVKALEETGLDNIIDHEGNAMSRTSLFYYGFMIFKIFSGHFTLFAPTNEAFENIPEWAGNIPLKELLRFHVARGLIYTKDITNDHLARSLLPKRDIRLNLYKVKLCDIFSSF